MNITECIDKKTWKKLVISLNQAEFLQSWEWGEIQKKTGYAPLRLIIDTVPIQGFVHRGILGLSFVYFPRIPHLSVDHHGVLVAYLQKQKYIFARIEPVKGTIAMGSEVRCRQPQVTSRLDLSLQEDELLAQMHAKTRYNIRLSEKKGVIITHEKNVDIFWSLNTETTARDKFKSHEKEYYAHMIGSDLVEQYTAWHEGVAIASIICIQFQHQYVYLHGVSSNAKRNLMAPYLLQWKAMQDAKQRGVTMYDFWGIAPQSTEGSGAVTQFNGFTWQANHPWTGVTRFKVGFGGTVVTYPSAYEVPLKRMVYTAINLIKRFR